LEYLKKSDRYFHKDLNIFRFLYYNIYEGSIVMSSRWTMHDTQVLIDNYHNKTIDELLSLLPGKTQEGVNNKVKRLKKAGKIVGGKTQEAVDRAYKQRSLKK